MNRVIWPYNIKLDQWAATLVGDFGEEALPLLLKESDFEKWGTIIAGTGIFAQAGVPSPSIIRSQDPQERWVKWAKIVYTIMSDKYSSNQF